LGDTDVAAANGVSEPVAAGDQIGGADPIPTLHIGPTTHRSAPSIDIAVAIAGVHTTFEDGADHGRQRAFGASPQLFELLEQLGELPPIESLQRLSIDQLVDREHRFCHLNPPITAGD
jgi:hypothetical protein